MRHPSSHWVHDGMYLLRRCRLQRTANLDIKSLQEFCHKLKSRRTNLGLIQGHKCNGRYVYLVRLYKTPPCFLTLKENIEVHSRKFCY